MTYYVYIATPTGPQRVTCSAEEVAAYRRNCRVLAVMCVPGVHSE